MVRTESTLWLTPREPLQSALRTTIQQLASSLDAVAFEPHVTVFCGPSNDPEATAVATKIARQFGPVELTGGQLQYTDRYTKTLFLQFHESAPLRRMSELAAASYTQPSNYALSPHLSLIYRTLPEARQRELCQTIEVPDGPYWFDRIRMIETELPIEDAGPVKRWRVICEAELTGTN